MTTAATLWTAIDAADVTAGRNTEDWRATGVSIDSRTIAAGDLFVALAGPNFDGHDFVARALAAGAAAAMVSRVPDDVPAGSPMLVVDDTMAGLTSLARAARNRTGARIVAVTGSAGKTGTKAALQHVLSQQGPTTASTGSLNNHWGVPLSLARMPEDCTYGVFEVGMNHAGEIAPLSRLIHPHVAVITNVEMAHAEYFDSVAEIADAKAEILQGLDGKGVAVLNRDNDQFTRLHAAARAHGVGRIDSFGGRRGATVRLLNCTLDPDASDVTAEINRVEVRYRISLPGRHWVMNSLAVLAAVNALGADAGDAAAALRDLPEMEGRGMRHRIEISGGSFTLVDESYNANPASMRALIDTLARMEPGPGGRRIAVLGEMLELGAAAPEMHADLATPLAESGIDLVFTAGTDMARLHAALPAEIRGTHVASGAELTPDLRGAIRPGDIVAVKGSNASRMRAVVEALLAPAPAPVDGG